MAKQQTKLKERLDWSRCRGCSVTDANFFLDIHAWMPAEVLERASTQGDRCGMARAELSRILATELLNSRQRSGQRGYVDVELEGQPTEEPPVDARPDVHQVFGAATPAPASGPLASIPEETKIVNAVVPQAMETEPQTRPRQPESEPGSELGERNVRPRVGLRQSDDARLGTTPAP